MHFNTQTIAFTAATFVALAASTPITSKLSPRDVTDYREDLAAYSCGLYSSADNIDTRTNVDNLEGATDSVTLPARSCGRIGCYNTSGVYVCNDQDREIVVPKSDAAGAAYKISVSCGPSGAGNQPLSGRVYSNRDGGYNVNVGFCDNSVSTLIGPASYSYPGPDGEPQIHCGTELGFEACLTPEQIQG